MRVRGIIAAVASAAAFFALFASSSSASPLNVPIVTDSGFHGDLSIYGNDITYGDVNATTNLLGSYVYNMKTHTTTQLPAGADLARMFGNHVAYEDISTLHEFVYTISTGQTTDISVPGTNGNAPDISRTRVVWAGDANVFMYDIQTGKTRALTSYTGQGGALEPSVGSRWVTWTQAGGSSPGLYAYNLTTHRVVTVTTQPTAELSRSWGNIITWDDHRTGAPEIYMKNMVTGQETLVSKGTDVCGGPAIYGSLIAYTDNTLGDIFEYNIATGATTQITNTGNTYQTAIYRSRIIWLDYSNGNPEIYGNFIPPGIKKP